MTSLVVGKPVLASAGANSRRDKRSSSTHQIPQQLPQKALVRRSESARALPIETLNHHTTPSTSTAAVTAPTSAAVGSGAGDEGGAVLSHSTKEELLPVTERVVGRHSQKSKQFDLKKMDGKFTREQHSNFSELDEQGECSPHQPSQGGQGCQVSEVQLADFNVQCGGNFFETALVAPLVSPPLAAFEKKSSSGTSGVFLVTMGVVTVVLSLLSFTYLASLSVGRPLSAETRQEREALKSILDLVESKVNLTANPCIDPYEYACGGWLKSFELPKDEPTWSASFSYLRNKTAYDCRQAYQGDKDSKKKEEGQEEGIFIWDLMVETLFDTCMDTDRIDQEGIIGFVDEIKKGAPFILEILEDSEKEVPKGRVQDVLTEELKSLNKKFGISPFLAFGVGPSVKDREGKNGVFLWQTGLGLSYKQYKDPQAIEAYRQYLATIIQLFVRDTTRNDTRKNDTRSDTFEFREGGRELADRVISIERDLQSIFLSPEENRDPQKTTNLMTWSELRLKLISAFDLDVLKEPLFELANEATSNASLHSFLNQIIVDDPSYYSKLAKFIHSKWRWSDIQLYLTARTLLGYAPLLTSDYREARHEFQRKILGSEPRPRWRYCTSLVEELLPWPAGRKYILQTEFATQRVDVAKELVHHLKRSFEDTINRTEWMDIETKKKANEKLSKMTERLGFPDWLDPKRPKVTEEFFTKYYGKSNLDKMKNLCSATMHLNYQNLIFQAKQLGKPKDFTEWNMIPQTINANYDPAMNQILFPLALFQPPFLYLATTTTQPSVLERERETVEVSLQEVSSPLRPSEEGSPSPKEVEEASSPSDPLESPCSTASISTALTYGALGTIIGHEITHGFDDQGRQYNADGQLEDWWSSESARAHQKYAQCFAKQYGNYSLILLKDEVHLSGNLTLGENIADNGGFKIAHGALMANLNNTTAQCHPQTLRQHPLLQQQTQPDSLRDSILYDPVNNLLQQGVLQQQQYPLLQHRRLQERVGEGDLYSRLFALSFSQLWCMKATEKYLLKQVLSDPHSPGVFRVIGTLKNSHIYKDAYGCSGDTSPPPTTFFYNTTTIKVPFLVADTCHLW